MLIYGELALARFLPPDLIAYSVPSDWEELAQATELLVTTRVTSIESATEFEVVIVLETSNDGTHWEPVWQNAIAIPDTSDFTNFASATDYLTCRFVRFRAEIQGLATGGCRVDVRACGRSRSPSLRQRNLASRLFNV